MIFLKSSSLKAFMISCLKHFKFTPIVLVEQITLSLSDSTAILIKDKHFEAEIFNSFIIFQE